jgi:transposase
MKTSGRFLPEVRERTSAVEQGGLRAWPSRWAVVNSITPTFGCVSQTRQDGIEPHELNAGAHASVPMALGKQPS